MVKPSNTWKQKERDGARFFGAERNPGSGSHKHHSGSDSTHDLLYIEQKYRDLRSSSWWVGLWKFWRGEKDKAVLESNKPLVIIQHYKQQPGFLITCHSNDFAGMVAAYLEARGYDISQEELKDASSSSGT